jgi:hypothetical protein
MENFFIKYKFDIIIIFFIISTLFLFLDKGLAVGFGLLFILSLITFFVLDKLRFKDIAGKSSASNGASKKIYWLFLIVLVVHLGTTLFMHYADFQPFSGHAGDYLTYQKSAVDFSQGFKQGDFSLKSIVSKYPDLYTNHYYPAIVGAIYALTLPEEIIGLMLNVWFVAISIIFVYLIVLEIGASEKKSFIIGLIVAVYPSYIFNTGLLLKDAIEICFVVLGLLFLIKIIKKFNWYNFLVLYLALICVTHFRFYIGYALIITFIFSWFLFANMDFKKKIIYGIIFIVILGFIPQIAYNQGYYGINSFKTYFNNKIVNFYRQIVYNPITYYTNTPSTNTPSMVGLDSSFTVREGPLGYIQSFVYVLLGPFPWQIKNLRQSLALVETIPWYLLLFFVIEGIIFSFKNRIKEVMPLLFFSILVMIVIAIFDTNFGLIVRIRIPAFISLLCIASFGFNKNNIIYSLLYNLYSLLYIFILKGAR